MIVERLLAPPTVHPRLINLNVAERARRRLLFFHGLYDASCSFVHVAGTKGKGSVCELVRAAAQNSRRFDAVGCFTSPHLHSCHERVRVNGAPISDVDLKAVGERALEAVSEADRLAAEDIASDEDGYEARRLDPSLTGRGTGWGAVFFDRLLALALLHFRDRACDLVVMEAGIGGLYDSTNFLDAPAVSVITSVSKDHTALLGSTLGEIAFHKAGVMRRGVTTLTPTQHPEVRRVLEQQALEKGASLRTVETTGLRAFEENQKLAAACVFELLGEDADFKGAFWPARLEELAVLGRPLVVDAAHNGHSMDRLFDDLPYDHVVVVFGCGDDKEGKLDMLEVLRKRQSRIQSLYFVEANFGRGELPPSKRPARALELRSALSTSDVTSPPSTSAALDVAITQGLPVLVCGSVYVAAEAREWAVDRDPSCLPSDDWAFRFR